MKRIISVLLVLLLLVTTILTWPSSSYALTIYKTVTKYHLDMGALHIWGTGTDKYHATWQNGYAYGGSMPSTVTLTFGEEIQSARAYVLDSGAFQWSNYPTYSFNLTDFLTGKETYDENYAKYVSNSITVNKPIVNGKKVTLSYTASLKSREDFDIAAYLKVKDSGMKFVFDMLGGKGIVEQYYPDLHDRLVEGNGKIGEGVWGYMFFVPIVIEYQVIEPYELTIGDFTADLDVPASAKPGDSFSVKDKSAFYDTSEFACTQLTYKVDSGTPKTVSGWKGTSLGESISQSFADECSVTYTITTWNKYGDSKTASKTINISNDHVIEINPSLSLPEYTYEGHTEIAKDQSTFKVDGKDYSAARIYAERLASNSFRASSGTISVHKVDSTRAECTFSQKGTYSIDLNIRADGGGRATDSKSTEVRKTPYIEDSLTGFQKQNRKQVLTATVATYPGKPLTDYAITLKDKKTGDSVVLTPGNPQQNTSTIKTRIVTMTQDVEKGFAYITVEFLTKTPSFFSTGTNTQDFYYQIDVTDSKGDTDTKSKTFAVSPDLPPTPAISLDSAFLRNEGTNIATIKAEDITVAKDGDSVARTWYYGATTTPVSYTDVSTMDGYQKLSFGTDKIVGFNRVGVGKFTIKLNVKEVWTEPTLEEYVTDSEHLTGTATAFSDVQNVAPIVSLELLKGTEKNVLLIANNDTEYQTLLNNKTALKQALLANKIDANVVIKKLIGDTPSDVTGIQQKLSYTFPTTYWSSGVETDRNQMIVDSEKTYFTTWTMVGNTGYSAPVTVHAYNPYSGEVWSYTSSDSEVFSLNQDDMGKYLYLVYSNHTVILDKKTGTVAGNIGMALTGRLFVTDNLFFSLEGTTLYAIDQNALMKTSVEVGVSCVARVEGDLQFLTKTKTGVIRNILNLGTLTIKKEVIVDTSDGSASSDNYDPICIDSIGKVAIMKTSGYGTDQFSGILSYSKSNELLRKIAYSFNLTDPDITYRCFNTFDEEGKCNHVLVWEEDDGSRTNYHTMICFNVNTGAVGAKGQATEALNGLSFSAMFESKGTSYFYYNGWYLQGGPGYWSPAYMFTYNGATSVDSSTAGPGMIGTYDENITASDRVIASYWGDNAMNAKLKMIISSFPKTLAQETAEVIAKFTDKLTFIGDVNTTADQIKAAVDAPKPTIKITANNNGTLSLNNLKLNPGKKYYYDYEIKPITGVTKDKLTGLTAYTGSTTAPYSFLNEDLYVADSYEEDFNTSPINKFFTVDDAGTYLYGGYGNYYGGKEGSNGYTKLSFTVPDGKYGVLSFDYDIDFYASYWSGTNVFVDGLRMDESPTIGANNSYSIVKKENKIFYKLLYPGVHTIELKVSARSGYWAYLLLDNLRVDILATAPKTVSPTLNVTDGEDKDWYDVNGTFNIPNRILSYGAQASYPYYGGLPGAVTETYYYKGTDYPKKREYYETVPAGYLRKGNAHLGSSELYSYFGVIYTISGFPGYEIAAHGHPIGCVDEWKWMGIQPAGSYTHIADEKGNRPNFFDGWIDIVDTVTYPDNEVTRTGNMAFNSNNTRYYFPRTMSNMNTSLSLNLPKGEYLLKNLRIYYMENGQKVYLENDDCDELADLSKWTLSTGLSASIVTPIEKKADDEYVKIYKKGEKVLYNIFYDDYEKDPSKTGYWVYSHIPWPPDTLHPDVGKVLTAPIDRFYLSGKYTVTHWEIDNTQRSGTVGDASPYNKESNKAELTFYVNGEGKAPWITYIKTNPSTVKENNPYTLAVGVDDAEKDALQLVTEVYWNGKSIFTNTKTGITADAAGNYPEQAIAGLPTAKTGIYQVICMVSDYSGTGIKAYKFAVVSEGRILGYVNHTAQWDENRKKYNLKRFSEEVNRPLLLNDYVAMPTPRMRGTNVFWSGERFMLRAETEGEPTSVTVQLMSAGPGGALVNAGYSSSLTGTDRKTASGAEIWEGSLWNAAMINKWGRRTPEELSFRFTASYPGNVTKTHTAAVIMDSDRDYWQLHRLW